MKSTGRYVQLNTVHKHLLMEFYFKFQSCSLSNDADIEYLNNTNLNIAKSAFAL